MYPQNHDLKMSRCKNCQTLYIINPISSAYHNSKCEPPKKKRVIPKTKIRHYRRRAKKLLEVQK